MNDLIRLRELESVAQPTIYARLLLLLLRIKLWWILWLKPPSSRHKFERCWPTSYTRIIVLLLQIKLWWMSRFSAPIPERQTISNQGINRHPSNLRVLFVPGLEAGGSKEAFLRDHFGQQRVQVVDYEPWNINESVRRIDQAIKAFKPDVVVGSSFGGGLVVYAQQSGFWKGATILLAPATGLIVLASSWRRFFYRFDIRIPATGETMVVHGQRDRLVPVLHSEMAVFENHQAQLIVVDDFHPLKRTVLQCHPQNPMRLDHLIRYVWMLQRTKHPSLPWGLPGQTGSSRRPRRRRSGPRDTVPSVK